MLRLFFVFGRAKMIFFWQSPEKKWEKSLKREIKELKKAMISAGIEKQWTKEMLEILQEVLKDAYGLKKSYKKSKEKIEEGKQQIEKIFDSIGMQSTAEKVRNQLYTLVSILQEVYHECTIRKDDMDFESTYSYLKRNTEEYKEADRLMLQSELENLYHLLEEIGIWEAPDFCAMAYYCKYENREVLGEFENGQRNQMLFSYYENHFWKEWKEKLENARIIEHVFDLIKTMMTDTESL